MEYRRDQVAVDLMRDLSNDIDRLMTTLRQSDLLGEALGLQNPQLETAVEAFISGKSGYLEPLDAVRSSYDIAVRAIDARFTYLQTTAHLAHTIGWSLGDSQTTPGVLIANRLAQAGLLRR
jgi:outer membrane protein TolC